MLHYFAYCIYEGTVRGEILWGEMSGGNCPEGICPRRNDQRDTAEREIT